MFIHIYSHRVNKILDYKQFVEIFILFLTGILAKYTIFTLFKAIINNYSLWISSCFIHKTVNNSLKYILFGDNYCNYTILTKFSQEVYKWRFPKKNWNIFGIKL